MSVFQPPDCPEIFEARCDRCGAYLGCARTESAATETALARGACVLQDELVCCLCTFSVEAEILEAGGEIATF